MRINLPLIQDALASGLCNKCVAYCPERPELPSNGHCYATNQTDVGSGLCKKEGAYKHVKEWKKTSKGGRDDGRKD